MTRHLWLFILASITLLLCSCSSNQKEEQAKTNAQAAVQKFIQSNSGVTREGRERWRMADFTVFGSVVNGNAEVNCVTDSPSTYKVVQPFWCEGRDLKGQEVKLRRQVSATVVQPSADAPMKVQDYELLADEPLTFGSQFGGWFLGVGKYWVIVLGLALMATGLIHGAVGRVLFVFGWLGGFIYAGWAGYDCFNSGWAILGCVPLYFVLALITLGIIGSLSNNSTRTTKVSDNL